MTGLRCFPSFFNRYPLVLVEYTSDQSFLDAILENLGLYNLLYDLRKLLIIENLRYCLRKICSIPIINSAHKRTDILGLNNLRLCKDGLFIGVDPK